MISWEEEGRRALLRSDQVVALQTALETAAQARLIDWRMVEAVMRSAEARVYCEDLTTP